MIERMAREIIELKNKPETGSASSHGVDSQEHMGAEILPSHGLSQHVRQLRKRNKGVSRWFGLAVILGAIMAIAFVGLFAR